MKVSLVLIIAVIGFVMVTAEETLEDRLKMALKRLLEGEEELHLEGRDTKRACLRATQNCNDHGECVEDSRGEWYCQCQLPYRVGGSESSCYLPEKLEMEIKESVHSSVNSSVNPSVNSSINPSVNPSTNQSLIQSNNQSFTQSSNQSMSTLSSVPEDKKEDLEMEIKDSVSRCLRDTNNCDGHGKCEKSSFGRSYICFCDTGYISNSYGGCSAASTSNIAREVELALLGWGTLNRCFQDTNNCDGAGVCVQSTFGPTTGLYICMCIDGYRNNVYGGCSPRTERDIEYLSMIARDQEMQMQARDSLARCNQDTNNCDGNGECKKSVFGRTYGQYICSCNEGYRNNIYGGCSPEASGAQEQQGDQNNRDLKIDVLRRLADLLAE